RRGLRPFPRWDGLGADGNATPGDPRPAARSAEPALDVGLGRLLVRIREDLRRGAGLHQATGLADPAEVEERGLVGDSRRLLHVVRDDGDGVLLLELVDQVLD